MIKYGQPPIDLGIVSLDPRYKREMMFYLYMPIHVPTGSMKRSGLPSEPRIARFGPLVEKAINDFKATFGESAFDQVYVYLTAKTCPVGPGCPGNREGWHADGYGSNGDVNYIWADMNPTEFAIQEFVDISEDDQVSMQQFAEQFNGVVTTYPNCSLLRLDESIIHRVAENMVQSGVRTFVKISFSRHKFNNEGNTHNYALDYDWDMVPRGATRNLDYRKVSE